MNRLLARDNRKYLHKPNVIVNLKLKMIGLVTLLIVGLLAIIGVFLHYLLADTLEEQMGNQALRVAQSVTNISELRDAMETGNPELTIQSIVEPIRVETGAEFIVVGNQEEVRYSHPDLSKVGQRMVGEDNERALIGGESYVSIATGSLGQSIRAKVPVVSSDGEIIGVVSVGFLMDDVQGVIETNLRPLMLFILFIGVGGVIGAVLVASYIKKLLFGLEPEEISHLLLQKESILQSTHEGILAVNQKGEVTLINAAAQQLLFENQADQVIGKPISDVLPPSRLPDVLDQGVSQFNQEMRVGTRNLLVNRVPIHYEESLIGAVATFRDKTEIETLTTELSSIKAYAEGLRAQTHEFSNKLSIILGLLHLDKSEEAIRYIKEEHGIQQEWIHKIIELISDPLISAMLLGKIAKASEQHISITIQEGSQLSERLSAKKQQALLTSLGNILDNAIDAVHEKREVEREILMFFTDIGDSVLFEIEDSGDGIPNHLSETIFTQGFSTKVEGHRGFGLALSKQSVNELGGQIYLEESELGGACFIITLPKDSVGGVGSEDSV